MMPLGRIWPAANRRSPAHANQWHPGAFTSNFAAALEASNGPADLRTSVAGVGVSRCVISRPWTEMRTAAVMDGGRVRALICAGDARKDVLYGLRSGFRSRRWLPC